MNVARALAVACAVAPCACVPAPAFYRGTGAVQVNETAPELAAHSVLLTTCGQPASFPPARDATGGTMGPRSDPPTAATSPPPFAIVVIGDDCSMSGAWHLGGFQLDTHPVCTLAFPGGARSLRVTDVFVRHGDAGISSGTSVIPSPDPTMPPTIVWTSTVVTDTSHVELDVTGVDARTNQLAIYRFLGRAASGGDDWEERCAQERARRDDEWRAATH